MACLFKRQGAYCCISMDTKRTKTTTVSWTLIRRLLPRYTPRMASPREVFSFADDVIIMCLTADKKESHLDVSYQNPSEHSVTNRGERLY